MQFGPCIEGFPRYFSLVVKFGWEQCSGQLAVEGTLKVLGFLRRSTRRWVHLN